MKRMTVLETALWWNGQGVNVLPIIYKSKKAMEPWKKWQTEKQGEVLVRWWFERKHKNCNIGVMTGRNLVVIDFDSFPAWLAWSPPEGYKQTLSVKSGRGAHAYFRVRENFSVTAKFENGEIKGSGYVVCPPSVHPSGSKYFWMDGPIVEIASVDELGLEYTVQQREVAIGEFPQKRVLTNYGNGIVGKIKRQVNIYNFLNKLTNNFVVRGGNLMCSCPFHDDRNPSMTVHPEEGWCYCFNPGCQAHKRMDVIDVASMFYRVNNSEAIRILSYEVD